MILLDELKQIRKQEANIVGELIGAQVINLDIPDIDVDSRNGELIRKLEDVIRCAKPDFIITHNPMDYMKDPLEVQKMVFDASFSSSVPHYVTDHPYYPIIPPIYYMDSSAGAGFIPAEYVDISEHIETKIRMVECHQSQVKWLKDHDGIDFLDFVRTISKFRGQQCGVAYAEGFTQCMTWPRLTVKRLLP